MKKMPGKLRFLEEFEVLGDVGSRRISCKQVF